jgi:hypothetical protein
MDANRFDDFTKALATSTSRRQVLKTLAASAMGSIAAFVGVGQVFARTACRPLGSVCSPLSVCCSGNCNRQSHRCDCPSGQTNCGTVTIPICTTPINDPNNCGFCGHMCQEDQFCFEGECVFSCFTAGTRIAMADGTSRAIEDVMVGDLVLGHAGQANRVIEIERPVLGPRHLYALNDGNFFVTAEHPFMTEMGWKSINSAALAAENSALHVGQLTVGDRLLKLVDVAVPVGVGKSVRAGAFEVRLDAVPLRTLVGRPADPKTQLYNLRLDGDHAYFANDLLVHNK